MKNPGLCRTSPSADATRTSRESDPGDRRRIRSHSRTGTRELLSIGTDIAAVPA